MNIFSMLVLHVYVGVLSRSMYHVNMCIVQDYFLILICVCCPGVELLVNACMLSKYTFHIFVHIVQLCPTCKCLSTVQVYLPCEMCENCPSVIFIVNTRTRSGKLICLAALAFFWCLATSHPGWSLISGVFCCRENMIISVRLTVINLSKIVP